jgi:hypothetical protein
LFDFSSFLSQKVVIFSNKKVPRYNNIAFVHAFKRTLKEFIMSYTYQGTIYSIASPVRSVSVNKNNVAVTDKNGTKLISFTNVNESKSFLAWIYQS